MKSRKELPLRLGVGVALLNHENEDFCWKKNR